jgi:Putative Flp pilus-assembly TadE/G-like
MGLLLTEPGPPLRESPGRKLWFVAGSVVATAVFAGVAFMLGAWAFDTRRALTHETRLQHLVDRSPALGQVVQGLEDEGSPLVAAPSGADELRAVVARHAHGRAAEALEKGRRWRTTRVFLAGDMVYFIYFDDADVMRDYLCVPAR